MPHGGTWVGAAEPWAKRAPACLTQRSVSGRLETLFCDLEICLPIALCSGFPPAFCRTPAPPNPANMATTTEAARPKREAKAVEHFTIESKEVDPDDLKIKAGGGAKFGDVENIVFKIAKLNAQVRLGLGIG